jgi:hypothetical protein
MPLIKKIQNKTATWRYFLFFTMHKGLEPEPGRVPLSYPSITFSTKKNCQILTMLSS